METGNYYMGEKPVNDYNQSDLFDFLVYAGIQHKQGTKETLLDRCPFCETDRQKKSDHFSFNTETGQYHCIKCEAKGNLVTFKREMGFEPFKLKIYTKPDQQKAQSYAKQPETYRQAYEKARGIPAHVLEAYCVGKADLPNLGLHSER